MSILLATGVEYEIVADPGEITEDEIAAFARSLDEGEWHSKLTSS